MTERRDCRNTTLNTRESKGNDSKQDNWENNTGVCYSRDLKEDENRKQIYRRLSLLSK